MANVLGKPFLPVNVPENLLHPDDLNVQNQLYYVCSITDNEFPYRNFLKRTFGESERYNALDEALQDPGPSDKESHNPGNRGILQVAMCQVLLNDYIHLL